MTVYRSAHGKPVDMTALSSKHEKVRAVGNMNVNARGDIIDNNNNIITDTTRRVKSQYNSTVGKNPVTPNPTQKAAPKAQPKKEEPVELSKTEQELFDELDNEEDIEK